jgi:hypothetical protein
MSETQVTLVDQNQIKFNMALTASLLIIGYLLNNWIPVAVAIVCQFSGALGLSFAPFRVIYTRIVLPAGIMKPNEIPDNHAAHRFASVVGGLFDLIGVILILAGMSIAGWIFIGIVFLLSILNLFLGFCAGCFMYYILNKLGIPGFSHSLVKSK